MIKEENISAILLMCSLTILIVLNVTSYQNNIQTMEQMDYKIDLFISKTTSYMLYDPTNANKFRSNGVFFSKDDYYCVKTINRDWSDIRNTDYHEMCHAFIKMDRSHFCNKANQTNWNVEDYKLK